jgi:hypothetical protein
MTEARRFEDVDFVAQSVRVQFAQERIFNLRRAFRQTFRVLAKQNVGTIEFVGHHHLRVH